MISAVNQLGVLHFEVFTGRFDAAVFVEFLTKLMHDIDRPDPGQPFGPQDKAGPRLRRHPKRPPQTFLPAALLAQA